METNPTEENGKYSRAASDAFLAQLRGNVERAAAKLALKAIVAERERAAQATSDQSATTVVTPTTPVLPDEQEREAILALDRSIKQITDALRAGDLDAFAQRLNDSHQLAEEENGTVAIAWLESYARSSYFDEQPAIAAWLLTDAMAIIAQVPAKWRLGLIMHLARSSKFIPTFEWFTAIARFKDNTTFEHFFAPFVQAGRLQDLLYELLKNAENASVFVRTSKLLSKIPSTHRFALASQAFTVCDLPPQWATTAHEAGFTNWEIGELLTLRCRRIRNASDESLTTNDHRVLEELLQPAPEGGISYRSVLNPDQLSTVVTVVRTRHPRRNFMDIEAAIRVMCLGTMEIRYPRGRRLY